MSRRKEFVIEKHSNGEDIVITDGKEICTNMCKYEKPRKKASFINKLYIEACDASNKDISFDEEGEKVVINNKKEFVKKSMEKISNAKDYSGFVRQLNNYGFTKIKLYDEQNTDKEAYFHQNFSRDAPENLYLIHRGKQKKNETKENIISLVNSMQYLINCNFKLQNKIDYLNERVNVLERKNQSVFEILGYAFKQGINTNLQTYVDNLNNGGFITENSKYSSPNKKDNHLTYHITSDSKQNLQLENNKKNKKSNKKTVFEDFYF
ncbi:HSF [Ecytonucleospora hepatopenaei]|uniref:HSF n=1 Tax=Ecytonucleospora hepatopenaei TaxID=646526 RepID=A0A1W0E6E9_9MICR|nr:HSF [Ecytonucleospora hepatopenaei]